MPTIKERFTNCQSWLEATIKLYFDVRRLSSQLPTPSQKFTRKTFLESYPSTLQSCGCQKSMSITDRKLVLKHIMSPIIRIIWENWTCTAVRLVTQNWFSMTDYTMEEDCDPVIIKIDLIWKGDKFTFKNEAFLV